jgi:hypothetical protein
MDIFLRTVRQTSFQFKSCRLEARRLEGGGPAGRMPALRDAAALRRSDAAYRRKPIVPADFFAWRHG